MNHANILLVAKHFLYNVQKKIYVFVSLFKNRYSTWLCITGFSSPINKKTLLARRWISQHHFCSLNETPTEEYTNKLWVAHNQPHPMKRQYY